MDRDMRLDEIREALIRQEETIIFALIERAQFKQNPVIYQPTAFPIPGWQGSFSDWLLWETEVSHAKVRRYTSPDEHPFHAGLPPPLLPPMTAPAFIRPNAINFNPRIAEVYHQQILPLICAPGDCGNYGSSATCDVACLQALSKRIHYGKFVAEAKFREDPERFRRLAAARDCDGLVAAFTNTAVEEKLLRRVRLKGATYGQEVDAEPRPPRYKIPPETIADIYRLWVIPLTKEVELQYLLARSE